MADESTRSEIITLTRVLRSDMRSVLDQLTKDRMTLNDFERFSVPWRNCLHGVTAGESLRREYLAMLHKLVGMVYQHLPAEGRNLRELSRVDEPDGWDWDAAAGELQGIEVAALAATNTPAIAGNVEAGNGSTSKTQRRASTNARMLDVLTRTPDCRGWTVSRWSAELKCSRGAIHAAPTWKELKAARDLIAAEHATTKRRRSAGRRKT
jgi:hypothetical protein